MTVLVRRRPLLPLAWFTAAVAAGCADDPASGDDDAAADSSTGGGDTDVPRYWQDVAPIFFERCGTCHTAGGVAPFVLDTYAEAASWAAASALAVSERTMPPWLVTDDGTCGSFRDSRALTQEQIDTIVAWADGGAPEGEPRTDLVLPPLPSLASATELATPAFAPIAQGGALAETDEYRCFLVEPSLATDSYMRASEVVVGNAALTHHVLLFDVDPTLEVAPGVTNADAIAALDDASPDREGWPCFGSTGDGTAPGGVPVSWAPGQGIARLPDGIGYPLHAGSMLVMQVHYNLAGTGQTPAPFVTRVRLETTDTTEREAFFDLPDGLLESLFGPTPDALAAGEAEVDYSWELDVADIAGGLPGLDVLGVLPHMHRFGVRQRFEIIHADDTVSCGSDVQHWDFAWQIYYMFEESIRLVPGDRVRVTCTYDTRGAEGPVLPGWGTDNEMCLLGVLMAPVLE
ncbi:MAG: hypothetical protein IPH07_03370 [Deltaproteobacteria bacterium]|nr:hypothetical protein [Deltaproteobacteria bacterium]MBK8718709.1 hypothetical protein [Deltaproteobacteria bacterium]